MEARRGAARLTRRQAVEGLTACGMSTISCLTDGSRAEPTSPAKADAGNAPWLRLPPTPTLPTAPRNSGHVTINGARIFFAQFGEGPPVLLLHGGLANSHYWGHQLDVLAKDYSVTVMDTRGHGQSPVTSRSFGFRTFAEDVVGLMDLLKIPAAAIVGWSDGGITGLQLAISRPERVSRLFAFGANSSRDGLKANGSKTRVFAAFSQRCKAEYPLLSPHPERWPKLMDGMRVVWRTEPSFTKPMLAGVKLPVTISDGEYDEIIKRDHTEKMAHTIPGARLVILPRVSHFAMLQDPAQFNRALLDFLKPQT